jgi:hypothetical protein
VKGRRIAVLGFLDEGALERIVRLLVTAQAEVVVNEAPDTADAVLVGMDGDALLDRVAFVRDAGYSGPIIGIGRLTAPQRRRWGRMHGDRGLHTQGKDIYGFNFRQVLVNADPVKVDTDTVLVALEVGDGAEVVEVVATQVKGVRDAMQSLTAEIEKMRQWSMPALQAAAKGDAL